MSNNLSRTTVSAAQNQKEVTINDSDGVLDAAITETAAIDVTSSNAYTLSTTEWTQNFLFVVDEDSGDPADAAITLTVPATARGAFEILNNTAFDVTVEVSGQSESSPVVAAGDIALLTCDGSDVRQPSAGGVSNFLALSDTPSSYSGQGSNYVRVNSGATALEFTAASPGTAEGRPPFRGALLKLSGSFSTTGSATPDIIDGWATADYDTKFNGLKFWLGPDLTFTADNTTEELTATAHGMATGDGPFQLSNSGGALPTGLSAATDYWCIRVDANTLQVASSYANALATTAVAFSDDGSGTHTLERASRIVVPGDGSITRVRLAAGFDTASDNTTRTYQLYILKSGGSFPGEGMSGIAMNNPSVTGSKGVQVVTPVIDVASGDYFEVEVAITGTSSPNLDATAATFFTIEVIEDTDTAIYDFGGFLNGSPSSSQVVLRYVFPRNVTLPADAGESQVIAGTAATAQTDFDLQKNGASIGTVRFAASGTVATFVSVSETSFVQGDTLELVAPSSADATLADLYFTFAGTR